MMKRTEYKMAMQTAIPRRVLLKGFGRLAVGLALAPLAAACSITSSRRRFSVDITGTNTAWFNPGTLQVPVGATVIWKNNDSEPHTVACDPQLAVEFGGYADLPAQAEPWHSDLIYAGETWAHTFIVPGQYIYLSTRSEYGQMMGSIIVIA